MVNSKVEQQKKEFYENVPKKQNKMLMLDPNLQESSKNLKKQQIWPF